MGKRYYLDKLNIKDRPDTWNPDDERQKDWKKQRKKYGFDERETWSLDYTWRLWLYERLKAFKEWANIDLKYHKFKYKNKDYTQEQLIDMIIERLEFYFSDYNELDIEQTKYINEVEKIWALIIDSMWW